MMTGSILVTGSSGFLGKSVCEELRKTGYMVKEFDVETGQSILDRGQLSRSMADCFRRLFLEYRQESALENSC